MQLCSIVSSAVLIILTLILFFTFDFLSTKKKHSKKVPIIVLALYSGEEYFEVYISSLIKKLSNINCTIEIYVADTLNTEESRKWLDQLEKKHKGIIKIVRGDENGKADYDIGNG